MGFKLTCWSQESTGVQRSKYLITLNGFMAQGRLVASHIGVGDPEKLWDTAFKWKQSSLILK